MSDIDAPAAFSSSEADNQPQYTVLSTKKKKAGKDKKADKDVVQNMYLAPVFEKEPLRSADDEIMYEARSSHTKDNAMQVKFMLI